MKRMLAIWVQLIFITLNLNTAFADDHIVRAPIEQLKDSNSCGNQGCHTRIRKEWSETIHAHSTPAKDPIVNAFFTHLQQSGYDTQQCLVCHAPIKAIYADTKQQSPIFDEGVNCLFCHSAYATNSHPGLGIDYYRLNLNEFGGSPYKPDGESLHDSNFIELFRSVDMCAGCHRQGETDFILGQNRNMICQTCHMPSKQGKRSADTAKIKDKVYRHLFEGGHTEMLLSMALTLEGEVTTTDESTELTLSIANDAYHTIPTGFPFRAVYVNVKALDADDNVVWSNYQTHPYEEAPGSYFGKIFDEKDEVFAHYARDARPVWAQLLPARSTTKIDYSIPSSEVSTFEVKIYYRLLSEHITDTLKLSEEQVPEVLMIEDNFYVE